MRFVIETREARKVRLEQARTDRMHVRHNRDRAWHVKFAWLPVRLTRAYSDGSIPDGRNNGKMHEHLSGTIVWMEYVARRKWNPLPAERPKWQYTWASILLTKRSDNAEAQAQQ